MSGCLENTIHVVFFFLTLAISPVLVTCTIILSLYRKIIDSLLSIKYKEKYGGLLGADSVFNVEDPSKSIITALLMIEFEKKPPEYAYESIKQKFKEHFFENTTNFMKMRSLRRSAYGYSFYIKEGYTIDECVRSSEYQVVVDQKISLDEEDIQKFVSSYCNQPMPKDDTANWEVLVGTRPVRWRGKTDRYPMIIRFHHCLGDGINIFTSIFNYFADDVIVDVSNSIPLKKAATLSKISTFTKVLGVVNALFHAPGVIIMQAMGSNDETILQVPHKLSGNKIAVWAVTHEDDEFVSHVKQMKTKIKGTFFMDVLLSGLATSIQQYFKLKNLKHIPTSLKTCLATKFKHNVLPSDAKNLKTTSLEVTTSFVEINIPTGTICSTKPMISRLEKVHTQMKLIQNSPQAQIFYWATSAICPLLPIPLLTSVIASSQKATLGVTNLPGSTNYKFNGHTIENIIFWAPHRSSLGFSFSILTQGEKVQLGLMVDKSLISSTAECQLIVDNVLKHIRYLGEELNQL